jgi:hypothetical protein
LDKYYAEAKGSSTDSEAKGNTAPKMTKQQQESESFKTSRAMRTEDFHSEIKTKYSSDRKIQELGNVSLATNYKEESLQRAGRNFVEIRVRVFFKGVNVESFRMVNFSVGIIVLINLTLLCSAAPYNVINPQNNKSK